MGEKTRQIRHDAVGLQPDPECEIKVTHKDASSRGPLTTLQYGTRYDGNVGNVFPFSRTPKRPPTAMQFLSGGFPLLYQFEVTAIIFNKGA